MLRQIDIIFIILSVLIGMDVPARADDTQEPTPPATVDETITAFQGQIDVLFAPETDPSLRLNTARALWSSRQAGTVFLEVLNSDQPPEIKALICQAMIQPPHLFIPESNISEIPETFLEPLMGCFLSDAAALSSRAKNVLLHYPRSQLIDRLVSLIDDGTQAMQNRMAVVAFIGQLPGKRPIQTLVSFLDHPDEQLQRKVLQVLIDTLAFDSATTKESIQEQIWPQMAKMSDKEFLRRQLALQKEQHLVSEQQNEQLQQQFDLLKQRYLQTQTDLLDQIPDALQKIQFLQTHLEQADEKFLRRWALEKINEWCAANPALPQEQTQQLIALLAGYIADDNSVVRQLTANALEKMADDAQATAQPLLAQLTVEMNPQAQIAQMEALGIMAYAPAVDQAIRLLNSVQPDVATQAARTIGNIAVADSRLNDDEQLHRISQALIQRYSMANGSGDIRREIINAIWKLASRPTFQTQARTLFPEILKQALSDTDGNCRSSAVRALTVLLGPEVFACILTPPTYLLDDADPSVRFRVIEAIQKHGGSHQLDQIQQRLAVEKLPDTVKALRTTFVDILRKQNTEQVYQWAQQMINSSADSKETQLLFDQVINLLWQKIAQDKTENRAVSVDVELFALIRLADTAERTSQPLQSLNWYQKILDLQTTDEIKDTYRLKIINLALAQPDEAIVSAAQSAVGSMANGTRLNEVTDRFNDLCQQLSLEDDLLWLNTAQTLARLLPPLTGKIDPQSLQLCDQKKREITQILLDRQINLLQSDKPDEPEVIKIIVSFNKPLAKYSVQAPVEQKLKLLTQFRQSLEPKQPPAPQPEPTTPPQQPPVTPVDTPPDETTAQPETTG